MLIKVGDVVRYLDSVGGGEVKRIDKDGTAWVLEEDGFEMPAKLSQLVVIGVDKPNVMSTKEKTAPIPVEKPKVKPELPDFKETKEGENLNLSLAFIHRDTRQLSSDVDIYLINDDNFFVDFTWFGCGRSDLFYHDTIEPQTTLHIATIPMTELQYIERQRIQAIAYKSKSFVAKPAIDITITVNCSKFYKLHSFVENEYFDSPAYMVGIVKNDQLVIPVDLSTLRNASFHKEAAPNHEHKPIEKKATNTTNELVIDLHMAELLDNTSGMSSGDMLNYQLDKFREVMNENIKYKGKSIIFIHGKGNGVLRKAIEKELRIKYSSCYYQDASFLEYGFGATKVKIR